MGKRIAVLIWCTCLSLSLMAGEGEYAVSRIPAALLKNAHVVKRMEKISFEIVNTGEAIFKKIYAITILDENGDDELLLYPQPFNNEFTSSL